MSDQHIIAACELCGVDPDDYADISKALLELSDLYLKMQVAADTVVSSSTFEPNRPETFDRSHLEQRFSPNIADRIVAMATNLARATQDFAF